MDSHEESRDSELICSSLKDFFNTQLIAAAQDRRIEFSSRLLTYVTELLVEFQNSEKLFFHDSSIPILAELMAEAVEADNSRRVVLLKQMGDTSLMLTGYFPEALERRSMNLNYYQQMGGTAYGLLGTQFNEFTVYDELSQIFPKVCNVLNDVSEATQGGEHTVEKLLELYRQNSSERIFDKLKKQGVIPFEGKKDPFLS